MIKLDTIYNEDCLTGMQRIHGGDNPPSGGGENEE